MNFQPLFTSARVVTAIYRIVSTTLLLIYLARRVGSGRAVPRPNQKSNGINNFGRDFDQD